MEVGMNFSMRLLGFYWKYRFFVQDSTAAQEKGWVHHSCLWRRRFRLALIVDRSFEGAIVWCSKGEANEDNFCSLAIGIISAAAVGKPIRGTKTALGTATWNMSTSATRRVDGGRIDAGRHQSDRIRTVWTRTTTRIGTTTVYSTITQSTTN